MKFEKQFIIITGVPIDNKRGSDKSEDDINTLSGCDKVINTAIHSIDFIEESNTFHFKSIDTKYINFTHLYEWGFNTEIGNCLIRNIEIGSGSYQESWEDSSYEMIESYISQLQKEYKHQDYTTNPIILGIKKCLKFKKINSKIDKII